METKSYNHSYKEVINLITDYFNYKTGDKFNTLIVKKLKELRNIYPDEVIIETIKNEGWKIKNKKFDTESGKIIYFFTIISNNISFYNKKYNERKIFNEKMKAQNENNFVAEDIIEFSNKKQNINNNRDISSILEEIND